MNLQKPSSSHLRRSLFAFITTASFLFMLTVSFAMSAIARNALPDTFEDQFKVLVDTQPYASDTQWREFAHSLPEDAFNRLKKFLESERDVHTLLGIQQAFVIFTQESPGFRSDIADYALTNLKPGNVNRVSRSTLACLTKYRERNPRTIDSNVFRALVRHRAYLEPAPLRDRLGSEIRQSLDVITANLANQTPQVYILPFSFGLAPERKLNDEFRNVEGASRVVIEKWDESFRRRLLVKLSEPRTVEALRWYDEVDNFINGRRATNVLLNVVQTSLLEAYNDESLKQLRNETSNSILRHLRWTFRLWSDAFKTWHWEPEKRVAFDSGQAFKAESELRATISRLDGFLPKDLVDQYEQLINLYGGWRGGQQQGKGPNPYWITDWSAAAQTARKLNIIEGIAPYALIRWSRKLVSIDDSGNELVHGPQDLTNVAYLYGVASQLELKEISFAQGILPNIDLQGVSVAASNNGEEDDFILPKTPHSRSIFNTSLHGDQKRALSRVLAGFYLWRADIEYRGLGPKGVGESLDQKGKARAESFYNASAQLLREPEEREPEWIVGLGLFSRVLDLERTAMLAECKLRSEQLNQGQDYYGESSAWPQRYAWDMRAGLQPILSYLQRLESDQEREFKKDELETNVRVNEEAFARATALLGSANNLVSAGEVTLSALQKEVEQQKLRAEIAEIRERESNWLVESHRRAVEAQANSAQADRILSDADQFALQLVIEQINILKDNISKLQKEIPDLRREIENAQQQIPAFKERASEIHHDVQSRKQIRALLIQIIKTAARAVSIYYTGVDLVSFAESAYGAYKAADSGDWASSVEHAYRAANTATNGELGEELKKYPELAQKYVNSTMSDSLTEATDAIKKASRLSDDEALAQATKAIGRQALRFGISYLTSNTNIKQVTEKLGVRTLTSQQIAEVNEQAKKAVLNASYQALTSQGDRVLSASKDILGCRNCSDEVFRQRLTARISTGNEEVERQIVSFINDVKLQAPEADVAALKLQLVRAQQKLLLTLSSKTGIEPEILEAVIDGLVKKKLNPEDKLPPVPLPKEVVDLLTTFRLSVSKARSSIAFLTSEAQQNNVIDQLSEIEGDDSFNTQLDKVMGQLNTSMTNAVTSMNEAAATLPALVNELNRLTIDERQAEYKSKAQEWRTRAAERLQEYEKALLEAANESVVASQEQKKIEELGVAIARDREQTQRLLNKSRVNERDAANASVTIAELERTKARNQLSHWYLFNAVPGADERLNLEQARLFYLDYVNGRLVQLWRLVNAYEFDFSKLPNVINARPSYLFPTTSTLNSYMTAYAAAESRWDIERPDDYPVLSSYPVDDLIHAVPADVAERLRSYFIRNGAAAQKPLILEGEQDLQLLLNGLHFRIRPLGNPNENDLGIRSPIEAALRASGQLRDTKDIEWNDTGAYRLRLLGVILVIDPQSLRRGVPPVLSLAQEADGWISIQDGQGQKRAFMLPIPPMEQFLRGSISRRGFETRPLFATYTLKIDRTNYELIEPRRFKATVHFVAVGVPGSPAR